MSLYTKEARAIVHESAPDRKFIVDVVEYPRWLALRIYVDNFSLLSEESQVLCAEWLSGQVQKIRDLGIPCYLEKFEFVPNRSPNK